MNISLKDSVLDKAVSLFKGLENGIISYDGGYIISSFFDDHSKFTKFETIYYKQVKNILEEDDAVTFQTDGIKLHIFYEPRSYTEKYLDPISREEKYRVPFRFSDLNIVNTQENDKIYVAKKPLIHYKSFTVAKPEKNNLCYYFFPKDDAIDSIEIFFKIIFLEQFGLREGIIEKALVHIKKMIKAFRDHKF